MYSSCMKEMMNKVGRKCNEGMNEQAGTRITLTIDGISNFVSLFEHYWMFL